MSMSDTSIPAVGLTASAAGAAMIPMSQRRLLTYKQWLIAVAAGLVIAAVGFPWYANISYWIGATLLLIGIVAVHLAYASRAIVPLPHIAVLIAALQYVLAAWVNYYFPPPAELYDIGGMLPIYLSYAGPVVMALTLGWAAAMWKLRFQPSAPQSCDRRLLTELDVLFFVGLAATLMGNVFEAESVAFAMLLLGNLRYVGLYGRMLVRASGWLWRLGVLLVIEVLFAAGSAMFHDLLLWSAWTFAVWIYCFAPKPRTILAALIAAVVLLPAFQESKWQLRDHTSENQATGFSDPPLARATTWLTYVVPSIIRSATLNMDADFIAETAVRYNQGWIINRVMAFVPEVEPFANGSTLTDSAVAALLPRFLAPDKVSAGGREYMLRFAGVEMNEATAMNLGYAGEMYANFGLIGGVIGCAAYGFALGILFRIIAQRAAMRPVWWSLVPFIFYASLKAEDDIAFVLNWTTKACVIVAFAAVCLPNLRRSLFADVGPGHTPETHSGGIVGDGTRGDDQQQGAGETVRLAPSGRT